MIIMHVHHFWVGVLCVALGTAVGVYLILDDVYTHERLGCPTSTIINWVDCAEVKKNDRTTTEIKSVSKP